MPEIMLKNQKPEIDKPILMEAVVISNYIYVFELN